MAAELAPWQQRACDQAIEALEAGRFGHALLICGPAGLGQREVAERLVARVLDPGSGRSGQLLEAGSHPDFHPVTLLPNREGTKLRTEIVIDQIRDLSQKLALTPQYGDAAVALIDPADAINRSACNALLKTLEEPVPGRYLWLVSAQPERLPATIRSRCQRLEIRMPAHAEALQWLRSQGHDPALAAEALEAARGHPGLANEWLREDGLALRRAVDEDLKRLERGEAGAVEVAQQWAADDLADARLRHAADLVLARASSGGLTDPARLHKLAAWFDAANRTRDLLRTTVRGDLAMVDLLLAWRAG